MKKLFITIVSGSLFFFASLAQAEMSFGVSLIAGQTDVSGHELENANTADKNSRSFTEDFYGGSLFAEYALPNGISVGLDYIPLAIEVGDGTRTDSAVATAKGGAENDTGTRKASAELENLFTLYANVPLEDTGFYVLGGVHMVSVKPSTTLPNSKYGSEDVFGFQVGLGKKMDNMKIELFYSDFEDIELSPTGGGNNNKIEADADAMGLKVAYTF